MITRRKRLSPIIVLLMGILLTATGLFADGPGNKNVRGGRGRPAWYRNIPNLIFQHFGKFRKNFRKKPINHPYDFRKRSKRKKRNSFNAKRKNWRFGRGRRNRRFGRW
ncbi:MAG: hypothetical protein OEZ20_06945 [candidate division WOR-3 bacterium]|nr:hypothetical protein [candidate division WOR-3 bacterium]